MDQAFLTFTNGLKARIARKIDLILFEIIRDKNFAYSIYPHTLCRMISFTRGSIKPYLEPQ